jgi:hypothetical protein
MRQRRSAVNPKSVDEDRRARWDTGDDLNADGDPPGTFGTVMHHKLVWNFLIF